MEYSVASPSMADFLIFYKFDEDFLELRISWAYVAYYMW